MSSSQQNFKFPDEDDFAHLGDEEMLMLMESADYKLGEQGTPKYITGMMNSVSTTWYLSAPAPYNMNYLLPTCPDFMRVHEAFKMFMFLHANVEYR